MVYNIPRGVLSFLGLSVLQPGCTLASPEEPVKLNPARSLRPTNPLGMGPHRVNSQRKLGTSAETAQASHERAQEMTQPEDLSQGGCRGAVVRISGGFPCTPGRCQRPKQHSDLPPCTSQRWSQVLLSLATESTQRCSQGCVAILYFG